MQLKQQEAKIGVLAIETSTNLLGVAVAAQDKVVYEVSLNRPRVHSEALLPLCLEALDRAKMAPEDLLCIAVTVGPGSFTGLRIGCATAQGLAVAWKKKVALVNTFHVLMDQCRFFPSLAVIMGKAKSQTVAGFYTRDTDLPDDHDDGDLAGGRASNEFWRIYGFRQVIPMGRGSSGEFAMRLEGAGGNRIFATGDGADILVDETKERNLSLHSVGLYRTLPRPGTVAVLGHALARAGLTVEPEMVVPAYYRRSQAEEKLSRLHITEGERVEKPS